MSLNKLAITHDSNYRSNLIVKNQNKNHLVSKNMVSLGCFFLFSLLTFFSTSLHAEGQTNDTTPKVNNDEVKDHAKPKTNTKVEKVLESPLKVGKIEGKLALNKTIVLAVENLDKWLKKDNVKLSKFILKIDGNELPDLSPNSIDNDTKLQFDLRLTPENKEEWTTILNRTSKKSKRSVSVTVRYPNTQIIGETTADLIPVSEYKLTWFTGISLVAIISFLMLAFKTDIIRIPGQQPNGIDKDTGATFKKAFSLGRTQMACWFFTVIISFVFIWLVIGDLSTLTATVLGLMGISAATGLSSAIVDSTKKDEVENKQRVLKLKVQKDEVEVAKMEEKIKEIESGLEKITDIDKINELSEKLTQIKSELSAKQKQIEQNSKDIKNYDTEMQPRVSKSLIKDILSDDDGISFHRFQIFSWTIVLIIIFVESVYKTLAMPDFNTTLLGLMGLSGATYIGFKIPKIES